MKILWAGLTYFGTMVALSTLIMSVLFFSLFFRGGWHPGSHYPIWFAGMTAVVVGPATLLLAFAARRKWRHRPIIAIGSMFGIGLAWTATLYAAAQGDPLSAGYAPIVWAPFMLGVVSILPVFLLCYHVLRRPLRLAPLFE